MSTASRFATKIGSAIGKDYKTAWLKREEGRFCLRTARRKANIGELKISSIR
jgi:hypothetical protein